MSDLVADVGRMYQSFPYPNYPLLGKLRWQEGYATSSRFAGKLFEENTGFAAAYRCPDQIHQGVRMLTVGCGEAQPYILRHMEPPTTQLVCVDLSERSLQRARIRLMLNLRRTSYHLAPIDEFLERTAEQYHHIDCYGVLHHLPNPSQTLAHLSHHLSANGTMRIMVYNREARSWIHHLQQAFRLLHLSPFQNADIDDLRAILRLLSDNSPALKEKLSYLGSGTLKNTARLIDTFLHLREARLSLHQWWRAFQSAGLVPYALYDRYAELEELPNPLFQIPSASDLESRMFDGRFENNLELFLRKSHPQPLQKDSTLVATGHDNALHAWMLRIKTPPKRWFDFSDTRSVPWYLQRKIWQMHVDFVYGDTLSKRYIDNLFNRLPIPTLKRLARIGAIYPGQCYDLRLRQHLFSPLGKHGSPRIWPAPTPLRDSDVANRVTQILVRKDLMTERRRAQVLQRLFHAQL